MCSYSRIDQKLSENRKVLNKSIDLKLLSLNKKPYSKYEKFQKNNPNLSEM